LPDHDDAGREHAGIVAEAFASVGATVRILTLPGLGPQDDVVDWVEAGGTAEQLHVLIDRDARPWAPSERESVNAGPAPDTKPRKKRAAVPSEDTLALDFAGRHADELRFISYWGKWLKWTAEKWQVEKTLAPFDRARKICRDHLIAASLRAKTVAAVDLLARSGRRLAATTDQWDADPWLFNTPAGTVELMTGNLREHRPQDYITKSAGCGPGAEGCPMFFKFLDKIFDGNQDLINYLQKFFGYILTGLTSEHAMLFFHGAGANGKSVLVSTIAGILGEYHRVAPIDTFTATGFSRHSTDLAGLMGARLVTAHETEEGAKWAEAKLKALTGGDMITAQFMRQDYFDYVPAFKLVITGNHKPGLQSVDEAMRRRLNLIPFNVTIPKADRDQSLAEKLKAEWPGILTCRC
jgi:putative DNA primase/helicase